MFGFPTGKGANVDCMASSCPIRANGLSRRLGAFVDDVGSMLPTPRVSMNPLGPTLFRRLLWPARRYVILIHFRHGRSLVSFVVFVRARRSPTPLASPTAAIMMRGHSVPPQLLAPVPSYRKSAATSRG
jgi:hypothetical protein